MADRRQKTDLSKTHISKPSLDTNASGLAESAISYSAFPEPPSSIPTTPIRSVFGESPSPSITSPLFPGPARYVHPYAAPPSNRFSRSTFGGLESTLRPTLDRGKRDDDSSSLSPSSLSPHDWHEGASSIDVDAAEDRLLPTSFITTLLQENAGPRGANRASYSSDAISGISEMTYPPKQPYTNSLRENSTLPSRVSSHRQSYRGPLPRPVGGRAPSSYVFRQNDQRRNSTVPDSHDPARTAIAQVDPRPELTQLMARSASVLSQSTLVAEPERGGKYGGKLAVHDEVDESDDNTCPADVDTTSSSDLPTHQINFAQQRPVRGNTGIPFVRESVHSSKSGAPSFKSRISSLRSLRRVFTWRRKPLPPVPIIPHMSIATEREHRRIEEETPLPALVNRADRLHGLLEKGYHPHHSTSSFHTKNEPFVSSFDDAETVARYRNGNASYPPPPLLLLATWVKERKMWVTIGIFAFITVVAIGTAVGVTAAGNKAHKSCSADPGGATCSLNATCVCTTSTMSEQCESPIAQTVLDLIPVMNDHLSTNLSKATVYRSLWTIQGSFQGSSCVGQVNLIDVSFALSAQHHPNRTQWAQIALLWTLTQTQDSSSVDQLHDFIKRAPWTHLDNSDGPVASGGSDFTTSVAGYNYDFAAQTIIPHSSTFITEGKPTNEQISRVDPTLHSSLDRIYSYAVASSRQQDTALLKYWTTVLHQREDMLNTFKAAFSSSPIILPFNGTSQSMRSLYNNSATFPPPIACYPGLSSDQQGLITAVEQEAFNLSPVTNVPQLNSACFSQHLTYGILDPLHMRLPFLDSRNAARQGIVLNLDAAPRAILAVGEALSALPGSANVTRNVGLLADPRSYGTTTFANHIILQYLSSVTVNTANAIINHVLTHSAPIPPPTDPVGEPLLFPLESIPALEVAVFGGIEVPDASSYLTAFTTPSGSLFFGSDDGSAFRTWAIGRGGKIAWTENATSPEVVYDNTFSDNFFNLTWIATSTAITNDVPGVGLINITNSFERNHSFSP